MDARGVAETIAPDGRCEIILHRAEPPLEHVGPDWQPQPAAFLYGPLTRALVLEQRGVMDVFGIRLHPWATGCLGEKPGTWRDRAVPLAEIMGEAASSDLLAVAQSADDLTGFIPLAELLLARSLSENAAMADVQAAIDSQADDAGLSVDGIAAKGGLTVRTLSRRFERACGLTAREWIRIARFQAARAALKSGADSLSAIAAEAGYADQAHMTREFRRLAGTTPRPSRAVDVMDVLYAEPG